MKLVRDSCNVCPSLRHWQSIPHLRRDKKTSRSSHLECLGASSLASAVLTSRLSLFLPGLSAILLFLIPVLQSAKVGAGSMNASHLHATFDATGTLMCSEHYPPMAKIQMLPQVRPPCSRTSPLRIRIYLFVEKKMAFGVSLSHSVDHHSFLAVLYCSSILLFLPFLYKRKGITMRIWP